ncbi:MAG: 50S ribosomal protein L10 [Alphaproteobacteria bacterium]
MDRTQKADLVESLKGIFSQSSLMVITHQVGLTVAEVTDLRRQMRQAGASFKVTKNRLARLALEGTPFKGMASLFTGPTAVACSKDPVAAARVAVKYAQGNEKLIILGGSLGDRQLDVQGIKALAELPSLDQLRSRLIGLLNTPATRIAGVLNAPAAKLARVFGAYGSKDGSKGEAA